MEGSLDQAVVPVRIVDLTIANLDEQDVLGGMSLSSAPGFSDSLLAQVPSSTSRSPTAKFHPDTLSAEPCRILAHASKRPTRWRTS